MALGGPQGSSQKQLNEEAAAWLARMNSDQATEADNTAFQKWLHRDPLNRKAYEEIEKLWSDLAQIPDPRRRVKTVSAEPQPPIPCISKKPPAAAFSGMGKGARRSALAACFLIAVLASFWGRDMVLWVQADYRTAPGETRLVPLPDGSQVHLNTDSALQVDFDGKLRKVRLLAGEAFFNVVKDENRPFEVAAGDALTRVTGTRFNVRQDVDNGFTVTVVSGSVEVFKNEKEAAKPPTVRLSPGEAAHYHVKQPAIATLNVNKMETVSWREGKLVFTNRPLREVVSELDRYRRGTILLMDPKIAETRFTGVIHLANTDPALDAIAESLSAKILHVSNYLVLILPAG